MHQPILWHVATPATFQRGVIVRAPFHFQLLQFVGTDAVFQHFADHEIKGRKRRLVCKFRLVQDAGGHLCWPVVSKNVIDTAVGLHGDLFLQYQVAVQASGTPAVQRLIQQRHRAPVGSPPLGHQVSDGHCGQCAEFFLHESVPLFGLLRFGRIGKLRRRPSRYALKIFSRQNDAFRRLHVAEHQQHGIVGEVVGVKESLHVGQIGCIQVSKIAVKIVRVRPIAKRHRRHIQPGKSAIGLVHHVDANFFLHDVALVLEIFVIDFQGAHAVGFKPQDAL